MEDNNKLMIDQKTMKSLMDQMSELEYSSEKGYEYEDTRVPRVTEVLSSMIHEDSLVSWANSIGLKRQRYSDILKEASDKGTYAHEYIAKFIKTGEPCFMIQTEIEKNVFMSSAIQEAVYSCVSAFTKWWELNKCKHKQFEPVFVEEMMVCPLFGGTCDLVMLVDGKYWLIDLKTSNHMNFKYSIQLAAYRYLLKILKGIDISRAIVLKLHKSDYTFEEFSLELDIPEHEKFINNCEQLFMMLLGGFKMKYLCSKEYKKVYGLNSNNNKTQERIRYEQEQANGGARL